MNKYTNQFLHACITGDINIITCLTDAHKDLIDISIYDNKAMIRACGEGHIRIVEHITKNYKDKINITARNNLAMIAACSNNFIKVVEHLTKHYRDLIDISANRNGRINNNYNAMVGACSHNCIEVVKHLTKYYKDELDIMMHNNIIVKNVILYGHIDILRHLTKHYKNKMDTIIQSKKFHKFIETWKFMKFDILKHLIKYYRDLLDITENDNIIIKQVYHQNNNAMFEYLLINYNIIFDPYLNYGADRLYRNSLNNNILAKHLGPQIFFSCDDYVAINIEFMEEHYGTRFTKPSVLYQAELINGILIIPQKTSTQYEKFYHNYVKVMTNKGAHK